MLLTLMLVTVVMAVRSSFSPNWRGTCGAQPLATNEGKDFDEFYLRVGLQGECVFWVPQALIIDHNHICACRKGLLRLDNLVCHDAWEQR